MSKMYLWGYSLVTCWEGLISDTLHISQGNSQLKHIFVIYNQQVQEDWVLSVLKHIFVIYKPGSKSKKSESYQY